jgi:formylglycine-generating enzyme required for sulfatase activity/serine/threonine protein kinase
MVANVYRAGQDGRLHSFLGPAQADGLPERLLDAILAEQRRDWIEGKRIPAGEKLRQHPELAAERACAAELIYHEFSLRAELGESPDWQQQLWRYPEHADLLKRLREADQLLEQTLAAPAPLPAGTFADYDLLEEVGRGGMGVVFKARHKNLDRIVALKLLRCDGTGEERKRFDREARAVARLKHPNIVQVYEIGESAGQAFVSLEFVDGQSLARHLHGTPLPPRQAAALVEILARAMQYAHEQRVIHRDLKPSNIMMRLADGTALPVIVDFGLARCTEPGSARLTASGFSIGTWQYMTPEQLCGEPDAVGPSCDIYALGVIMYELLTGRLPFDAPGQVVRDKAAPPSSFRAQIDPCLEAICLRAMAACPDARYASMGDLASALSEYLSPPAATPRVWSNRLVVTGIACSLITIATGCWAGGVLRARNSTAPTQAARVWGDWDKVKKTSRGVEESHESFPPAADSRDVVHLGPQRLNCTGLNGASADTVRQAQQAWAKYLGRDVEQNVEIADGVTMTFVLVPPGEFLMGSPPDEKGKNGRYGNETLHVVTFPEPFDLGKYEVTQLQYAALTGNDPSYYKGSNRPVERVSWGEADAFGRALTKKMSDRCVYRLPTEEEWEYSCRGGRASSEPFGIGDGRFLTPRDANYDNALGHTSDVGSYAANALGLHDMHGNVWEWCAVVYEPYGVEPVVAGQFRAARGGCHNEPAAECRSALRQGSPADRRDLCMGFRLARSIPSGVMVRVRPTN